MKQDYQEIQWLFFDIGSTLVDEDKAYEARIKTAITGKDISYQEFYDKMLSHFRKNKKGDLEALSFYGLERPAWRTDLETLYPQTKEILEQLGHVMNRLIAISRFPLRVRRASINSFSVILPLSWMIYLSLNKLPMSDVFTEANSR